MKRFVHLRRLLVLFLANILFLNSYSQTVTGIWKGYFISDQGAQYRLEFQVKQNDDGTISVNGVSYSWQDDIKFYGKATMIGSYVKNSNKLRIAEIRTVEVKSATGGGTCIMNYDLEYSQSGKEEFLEGTYLGKTEVKGRPNPYKWGECGGGTVYLRKVTTSDFYIEPFLRNKSNPVTTAPKKDTTVKVNPPLVKRTTPPANATRTPVQRPTTRNTTTRNTTTKNDVAKNNTAVKPRVDSTTTAKINLPAIKEQVKQQPILTPNVLKERSNELMKSLVVNSSDVVVKLYDNGEIDDDTISIYYDKKLILANKRLSAAPIVVNLKMDDDNESHELVMVAENLGRIPPNTALMIVDAGDQRFDVRITSTEQKNALVRFKYQRPK